MNALGLPTDLAPMLAEHAAGLDVAYREVISRLDEDTAALSTTTAGCTSRC